MFQLFCLIFSKTFVIKRVGSEEYVTGSFDPLSLPFLGPRSTAHIFEIAHPETDSKISILRLACVPKLPVIPDVVLDATRENSKVTYFSYNDKLRNEEFVVIRYENGFLIARDGECLTYDRDSQHFYVTECVPQHPEQVYELIEMPCGVPPQRMALEQFIASPPKGMQPIIRL